MLQTYQTGRTTHAHVSPFNQDNRPQNTDLQTLDLQANECSEMRKLVPVNLDPYQDFQGFTAKAMRSIAMMDSDNLAAVRKFASDPAAPGAMLVSGLPTDAALPPTPLDGEPAKDRESYVGETMILGLASILGEPVGYETEKDGQLIHNLIPIKGAETTQSNRGSSAFLSFHNDSVYDAQDHYHVYNPDFLILYGHRADPAKAAQTFYISARKLQKILPSKIIQILREPRFRMAAPANYTDLLNGGKKVWSKPMPVLFGNAEYPEIAVAANGVDALDSEAQTAFDALTAACQHTDNHASVVVDSGQALLINNRKGLHARSSFKATYGPEERWLLRANIRRNTWQMRDRMTDRTMVFS